MPTSYTSFTKYMMTIGNILHINYKMFDDYCQHPTHHLQNVWWLLPTSYTFTKCMMIIANILHIIYKMYDDYCKHLHYKMYDDIYKIYDDYCQHPTHLRNVWWLLPTSYTCMPTFYTFTKWLLPTSYTSFTKCMMIIANILHIIYKMYMNDYCQHPTHHLQNVRWLLLTSYPFTKCMMISANILHIYKMCDEYCQHPTHHLQNVWWLLRTS